MTDGEGTPARVHGAPLHPYHMAPSRDSFLPPFPSAGSTPATNTSTNEADNGIDAGNSVSNGANGRNGPPPVLPCHPHLATLSGSGSNGTVERLYSPQQQLHRSAPTGVPFVNSSGTGSGGDVHRASNTPNYVAPPNNVYGKAFPLGSQMPVSWIVNGFLPPTAQTPGPAQASAYTSASSSPSPSPAALAMAGTSHKITSGNGNGGGNNNTKNNNPSRNGGQSPSSGRNGEIGLNYERHDDHPHDTFARHHSEPRPNRSNSTSSSSNTANMARVVNTQENEHSSHNRNSSMITPSIASAGATHNHPPTHRFPFHSPATHMPNNIPVYHHPHHHHPHPHPHYPSAPELNRPYYQEYQSTPPNHHPLNHIPPSSQQQQLVHPHIHQINNATLNPPLIQGFASPAPALDHHTKSPIASHNVIMQTLPPQTQQQLHLQEGQHHQQYVKQQYSSNPQMHPYQANHVINSSARKIIKSPATQISNIINHDDHIISPLHSKRNSRSSISSLLSDPLPEKMDLPAVKPSDSFNIAEKTSVLTEDPKSLAEEKEKGKKISIEAVPENSIVPNNLKSLPDGLALSPDPKKDSEGRKAIVELMKGEPIKVIESIGINNPVQTVDESKTNSTNGKKAVVDQIVSPSTANKSTNNGKPENKLTLKIPAKRGRKPKALKLQLVSPELKDKAKVKNGASLKKAVITSKFVTLKVSSNKLKNILDGEKEVSSKGTTPIPNESTSVALVESKNKDNESFTAHHETTEMTSQQLIQIHQNNSQLIPQLDEIKKELPNLFQLNVNGIPNIPGGYIPLVMAPNGLLIPMEYINVNPNEKSVSIMHPVWEAASVGTSGTVIGIEGDSEKVDENVLEQNVDIQSKDKPVRKNFGFDNEDKLASLQLYLYSKEAKISMRKVNKVTGCRRFKKQISYYNRLLEREQLEFIENYRQERNKYQKMLNNLESGESMASFEKDLLERKDYELLREEVAKNYNDENDYLDYLNHVVELQSIQCLDYATRLVKLKNYLNMERVRLERHKNRLCRINTNKSHSIWKRYVKTGVNRTRRVNADSSSSCGNGSNVSVNLKLISQNDFMLLTNPNSRAYGTYVLNNSMDKGNENQNEIIELLEHFLPEDSTLRELYKEMKRLDSDNNDKNAKHTTSVNSVQKNDMISKYGLKESNSYTGNRLLKELQIDGMNVDIRKNDRIERRGSGQRKARNNASSSWRNGGSGARNTDVSATETDHLTTTSFEGGYSSRTDAMRITAGEDTDTPEMNGSRSDELDSGDMETSPVNGSGSGSTANVLGDVVSTSSVTGSGTGTRNELNITSCLDASLCDIDRVKMLNLNSEEIGMNFTKVYGMPKGLRREEVDSDLAYLRSVLH